MIAEVWLVVPDWWWSGFGHWSDFLTCVFVNTCMCCESRLRVPDSIFIARKVFLLIFLVMVLLCSFGTVRAVFVLIQVSLNGIYYIDNSLLSEMYEIPFSVKNNWSGQGLTLIFQAKGLKRSFDKNKWSETGLQVIIHTILGPWPEKSRGPQQNLGAYALGPLGKSNPAGKFVQSQLYTLNM